MTNSSNSGGKPPAPGRRFWLILFSRPLIGCLLVLLAILAGAGWRLWIFVNQELAPLIEKELSQSLNRPVELGSVERFSLIGLRFGESAIPPFTKRVAGKLVKEPDSLTTRSVDVIFNPLDLLLTRTLNLDVTLAQPHLYLQQGQDGRWVRVEITPRERTGPFKTNLQAVRFREAEAVLVPQGAAQQSFKAVDGNIVFVDQAQRIKFDGRGQISSGGEFEAQGQWLRPTQQVTLKAKGKNLAAVTLAGLAPQLPLQVRSGRVDGNLQLEFQQNQKQKFSIAGTARLKSVAVVVPDQYLLRSRRPAPRLFKNVNGIVQLLDRSQRVGFDLKGQIAAGGNLRVKGQALLPTQQANLVLQAQNLSASFLDGAFQLPINIKTGQVNANLNIHLRQNQQPNVQGTAQLQNVSARIATLPQLFRNVTGQLRFSQGLTTTLEQVNARYGQVPLQASGALSPNLGYDLRAQMNPVPIAQALNTLKVNLPFSTAGTVQGQELRVTGAINQPVLSGVMTTVGTSQVDRVPFSALAAAFRLEAPLLKVTEIRALPAAGGVVTGQASYDLRPGAGLVATLQAQNVPGDAIAQLYGAAPSFKVGSVSAQARISGPATNIETAVQFQAPEALYPTTGEVLISQGKTFLRNMIAQVAGGTVRGRGQVANGLWQATVDTAGVPLQRFSAQLRGLLSGRLNLSGTLASLQPENIRAQGRVRFSQGLSVIQQPLTALVQWNGQNILVQRATAPGFRANGMIAARLQGPQAPEITGLDLNVLAQNYALQTLPALGPTNVKLAGLADLTGRLTGTPAAPHLNASLRVNDLALNQVAFEPTLTGRLSYGQSRGLDLQLSGQRDRIDVALAANLQPASFYIRRDQAIATGRTQGERLLVDLQQFPLLALNLTPGAQYGLGPVSGLASGNFDVNLSNRSLAGSIAIERPGVGQITGDRFVGNLRFANGTATLSGGELRQGESQFLINATVVPGLNPRFAGQVQVARAEIQDVLTSLKVFNFADLRRGLKPPTYAKAAKVQPVSVGFPEAPLLTQLRRLSEIDQLLAEQIAQRQQASPLPDLADLQGRFNGQVSFSGSQQAGLKANFNLQGQGFDWGQYTIDQVIANGSFANGVVNLQPLRIASGDSLAAFTGQIGGRQQAGQLVLNNVPVDQLSQFVDLPFAVAGNLDAIATLGGSLTNPQAQGQLNLVDATLNETPVKTAQATFNYNNARLNLNSTAVIAGPEPLQIAGSIPYKLPFASVTPTSNQVSLNVNVKNDGLALLNLFTDQVAWVDGQGEADLQVRGTLKKPLVNGIISLDQATLQAQALPEPLTNVTGALRFNRDRIRVERLTGRFRKGQVVAAGVLPIFDAASLTGADQTTPLTVGLNNLALKLKGLYDGGIDGNLLVTGTALSPEIGGAIQLENGQVALTNTAMPEVKGGISAETETETAASEDETSSSPNPIRFNNLQVTLGNNVQVNRPPVLSLVAYGNLIVNGALGNLLPDGTIRFRRGEVNLFTTRFRLDPAQRNYAQFTPNQRLDPYLNVNLLTTVTEVTGARTTNLNEFAEVPASALGSLESIRVRAKVNGQASQLTSNFGSIVELSSSPGRSESEIIALLGGGFTGPLQQGNATLAFANLASSAFLNSLQGFFDNALGSRASFRLFPALIPNSSNKSSNNSVGSVLGLGAELGYDITRKLSVSALQVLTPPGEPTQLNVSYQLTDQLQVRTGINLEGEAVGLVEYRTRF